VAQRRLGENPVPDRVDLISCCLLIWRDFLAVVDLSSVLSQRLRFSPLSFVIVDRDFGHFPVSPRKFDAVISHGDICVSNRTLPGFVLCSLRR